jgi:outer membrane protein assembly factor BamB
MDHYVYSFDASTGKLLWKSQELGGALVGTPAVDNESLYIGTFGKELIALDKSNGSEKWHFATQDWVWSGPAISNGVLYFGDLSGYLYAVNASDGTAVWRIQPQNPIVSSPIVHEDRIYLTTEADTLYIIDTTGNIVSSKVLGGTIYSPPVVAGDTVLVAPTNSDALLIALNLDGNQKWTFTPAKK